MVNPSPTRLCHSPLLTTSCPILMTPISSSRPAGAVLRSAVSVCALVSPIHVDAQPPASCMGYSVSRQREQIERIRVSAAEGAALSELLAAAVRCDPSAEAVLGLVWSDRGLARLGGVELLARTSPIGSGALAAQLAKALLDKMRSLAEREIVLTALASQVEPTLSYSSPRVFFALAQRTGLVVGGTPHHRDPTTDRQWEPAQLQAVRTALLSVAQSGETESLRNGARLLLRQRRFASGDATP